MNYKKSIKSAGATQQLSVFLASIQTTLFLERQTLPPMHTTISKYLLLLLPISYIKQVVQKWNKIELPHHHHSLQLLWVTVSVSFPH